MGYSIVVVLGIVIGLAILSFGIGEEVIVSGNLEWVDHTLGEDIIEISIEGHGTYNMTKEYNTYEYVEWLASGIGSLITIDTRQDCWWVNSMDFSNPVLFFP